MIGLLRTVSYLPILKWKQGEYTALGTLPQWDQDHIAPLVVVPPAGDFDPEAGRPLEPAEHIKRFGPRVFAHWGQRPIFVDALYVDDERHRVDSGIHPLTSLLGRAQLAGAQVSPATSLGRSAEYQAVVARFVARNPGSAICVRITAGELESEQLGADLDALLAELSCSPDRAVIVIDFAGDEPPAEDDFIENLLERLNHLPRLHEWLQVALALTSFPEKLKADAGECKRYPRTDWEIYRRLVACGDRLLRRPIFGDYALEFPDYKPMGRATPRARFRYSTSTEYLVESGTSTKKPHGYKAIFPVAAALAARPEFAGESFSNGDAFIFQLAKRARGSGTAWQWRWATTEHHLRMVVGGLKTLFGIEDKISVPVEREPEQVELFQSLERIGP